MADPIARDKNHHFFLQSIAKKSIAEILAGEAKAEWEVTKRIPLTLDDFSKKVIAPIIHTTTTKQEQTANADNDKSNNNDEVVRAIRQLADVIGQSSSVKPWPTDLGRYVGLWITPDRPWIFKMTIDGARFQYFEDDIVQFPLEWEVLQSEAWFTEKYGDVRHTPQAKSEEVVTGRIIRSSKKLVGLGTHLRQFPGIRSITSDCYILQLSDDNSMLKGVSRETSGNWNSPMLMQLTEDGEDLDTKKVEEIFKAIQPSRVCYSGGVRKVGMNFNVNGLSEIDSKEQTFKVSFRITLSWELTVNDLHKFVSAGTLSKPDWSPPPLIFPNSKDVIVDEGPTSVTRINDELRICKELKCSMTASERLDLQNFPFDCQKLKLFVEFDPYGASDHLEIVPIPNSEGNCIAMSKKFLALSEWTILDPSYNLEDVFVDTLDSQTQLVKNKCPQISLIFQARRNSKSYLLRIVLMMCLLSATNLLLFGLDKSDIASRLSFGVTILLSTIAYSLIVSSRLPTVGYLTLLEKYILVVYAFISAVMLTAVLEYIYGFSSSHDNIAFYACAGVWLLIHVLFFACAQLKAIPEENSKLQLQVVGRPTVLAHEPTLSYKKMEDVKTDREE